jgi:tRNA threonylcarbamoyladenosine biosynthesis protein TsaE
MNTAATWQTVSSSSADTFETGEQLGRNCKGGEVFLLVSDLGGGKTTFTKGLAKGLGASSTVTSPTFMVERVYECRDNLSLHHFDFYRLQEAGIVARELAEVLDDPKAIVAIEWGDVVNEVLPLEHIVLKLERQSDNEESRKLSASYPDKFSYLFEGLK